MRTDVKLGVVISMVVVGSALVYFSWGPSDEGEIPVGNGKIQFTDNSKTKTPDPKSQPPVETVKRRPGSNDARTRPAGADGSRRGAGPGGQRVDASGARRGTQSRPAERDRSPAVRNAPSRDTSLADGTNPRRNPAVRADRDEATAKPSRDDARTSPSTLGPGTIAAGDEERLKPRVLPAGQPETRSAELDADSTAAKSRSAMVNGAVPEESDQSPSLPPPPRPTVDTSKAALEKHVVQEGDSFASIARNYYGSESHTQFLIDSNKHIPDPNLLRVGVWVYVPPKPDEPAAGATRLTAHSSPSPSAGSAGTVDELTYVVQPGDSFYRIALNELGDSSRWDELLELNKALVDGDPKKLKIGQKIKLLPKKKPADKPGA